MDDPVLDWLDRLDRHWNQVGQSPPLEDWLDEAKSQLAATTDSAANSELATELLRADLDWRLRQQRSNFKKDQLVAANLLRISLVREAPNLGFSLLDDEYAYRCEFGCGESPEQFAELVSREINQDKDSLLEHFLSTTIERKKIVVKLLNATSSPDAPVIKCPLGKKLEIGRANENEPPAPAFLSGEPARLIVANAREVSISRNQALLLREHWSLIKLKNISRKVPITIGDTKQLQPQRQMIVPVPFVMLLGKARIRVEYA